MKSKETIRNFVGEWINSHEEGTFVRDKYGNIIYNCGHSSLNLVAYFESILEDWEDQKEQK